MTLWAATTILILNATALPRQDDRHAVPYPVKQEKLCATHITPADHPHIQRIIESGLYELQNDRGDVVEVTIAWHVSESWHGERAVEPWELEHYLTLANEVWEPAGIRFAAHPVIDRIINPDWFIDVPDVNEFRSIRKLDNALNIYWAAPGSMGSLCGISAFTFSELDTIAIQPLCDDWWDVDGVFCHEIGHWFDLFHTHEGYGSECVERTNCTKAGDLLCGTPADFGLGFESCVDPISCTLREDCADIFGPCNEDGFYVPDTLNYMSYSAVPCMQHFSTDGIDRMRATAINLRTNYLNTSLHHPCKSDLNWDYETDVDDLLMIIRNFGEPCPDCEEDIDGNGSIGVGDILAIIDSFGPCFECLSESDCNDDNPYTFDRCLFGECANETMRADCCIQGYCIDLISPSLCESAGGTSTFENTGCQWACGIGDSLNTAHHASLGQNPFINTDATASTVPVMASMCSDTNLNWDDLIDVWMQFDPPADGVITISLCSIGSFDTSVVLYQGPSDANHAELVQIACNGDAPHSNECQSGHSEVQTDVLKENGRIFIRIGSVHGDRGLGMLTLDFQE